MGIEVGVALALTAVGTVAQTIQQSKNAKAAKKQARNQQAALDRKFKADEEARAVANAQQTAKAAQERQELDRERRVRVAAIQQQAENTGGGGSSGSIGAQGALSSGVAGRVAAQEGQIVASRGISLAQQASATATRDFQFAKLQGQPSQTLGVIGGALIKGASLVPEDLTFKDIFSPS